MHEWRTNAWFVTPQQASFILIFIWACEAACTGGCSETLTIYYHFFLFWKLELQLNASNFSWDSSQSALGGWSVVVVLLLSNCVFCSSSMEWPNIWVWCPYQRYWSVLYTFFKHNGRTKVMTCTETGFTDTGGLCRNKWWSVQKRVMICIETSCTKTGDLYGNGLYKDRWWFA